MNNIKVLLNGIIKENPTFVLLLGMCPTLGTTSSAFNGMSMGLATMAVLIISNFIISLIKKLIPDMVRIPSYIVVIASLVTVLQMLIKAYAPEVDKSLGLFIPLIVVNCIILGRAEAFAAKNNPIASIFDGIGIGLGFTIALTCLGAARELLGTGAIFGQTLWGEDYGMLMFVLAPGAFLALGYLIVVFNKIFKKAVLIIITAIFVNNVVLAQFLGICPFLGVSKKVDTASGMGMAVTAVLVVATAVTYAIQKFLLDEFGLGYLQTIAFILVIAALVQMIEIILKKTMPALYQALGVFLPLITTNCCILGVAILVIQKDFNLLEGLIYAASTGIGFLLAMVLFAGLREQLELVNVPKSFAGVPIALVTAGLLAMAFMGFSGVDGGLKVIFGL